MLCINNSSTAEFIVKKSRFISYLEPCSSSEAVQATLQRIAEEHPHASHIVFAFRIKTNSGIVSRFFDAGEPSGTAGKPIFQHIEGRDMLNCLLAVVRYFGGIKLGAGGLTRAYGNAARQAIESNSLMPFVEFRKIPLIIDYPQLQNLEYHLNNWGGRIESTNYGERIELIVTVPESSLAELNRLVGNPTQ